MKGVWAVLGCVLYTAAAAGADDCLVYKMTPRITVTAPEWTKTVVQPLARMTVWHGNVVATLEDNYDVLADITPIEDGFCVALKAVDAQIGYSDFTVQIDISHAVDSCTYNAVLGHEDEHIRAYLSVIDDLKADMHTALFSAADAVMPVFVPNAESIDAAVDALHAQIQAHPDIRLMIQKIRAAEEIRNKRVDQNETGDMLRRCMQ